MTTDERIARIIAEYNEHADAYTAVVGQPGTLQEEAYHAFMSNAIAMRVFASTDATLKARFAAGAHCS